MGASAESAGGGTGGADALIGNAKAVAGDVQEKVSEAVSTVRGKTGNLQAGIADWLDQSAQVIRDRATAEGGPSSRMPNEGEGTTLPPQLANAADTAAGLLERSAMWLRENDLTDVEARVTAQVRERPLTVLLLAAGVGFLISRSRD